jgi:hypothetical protein
MHSAMKWLLLAALLSSPLWAAERSPSLSLGEARQLVASMGIGVGKMFCRSGPQCQGDDDRYVLSHIDSRAAGPNRFVIEVEITPLPRHTY